MVNLLALAIIFVGSFIGATGTAVMKNGTNKYTFKKLLFSIDFWDGLFLYIIATVFYLIVLSMEQLSVVYPLVSLTYIWTTILSVKYLGEKMNKWKYFSLTGIIMGIVLIGIGS
ncbi:hypothetical protein HOA91_05070 [Candidatus Woesearchaeota archaeon]|jgi:drug/metabolite transporter (DMT)-like permease|nr:hypothetical protein [Candidatus Woesearchaeota archaeon]